MSEEMDVTVIPPSSLSRIPQSIARPSHEGQPRSPLLSSFQATPSRKSVLASSRQADGFLGVGLADHGGIPSSPLQPRQSVQLFNIVPESAVKLSSNSDLFQGVQDTPIKKRPGVALTHSHPNVPTSRNDKENMRSTIQETGLREKIRTLNEDSIYKSLGWDDADDIDDLA